MDLDIIETDNNHEVKTYLNYSFEKYLKLNDLAGVVISNVQSTNVLLANTQTCLQFDVDCNFQLELDVHFQIIYSKTIDPDEAGNPLKLKIHVADDNIRREIISCTNYLQRQCNINLALSVLKICSRYLSERKLIYSMLLLHFDGIVDSRFNDDNGILMVFECKKSGFTFFKSLWKIYFDCKERRVIDIIDFNINKQDRQFYNLAKHAMEKLIEPNLTYAYKVDLWSSIIQAANAAIHGSFTVKNWKDDDVLPIEEINSTQVIGCDSDSDSGDDCVIISEAPP